MIATANLRDKGVSEMSVALKRRFNFELVPPIADFNDEVRLVRERAQALLEMETAPVSVDDGVIEAIVTAFRDLRTDLTDEGWRVERPGTIVSTANGDRPWRKERGLFSYVEVPRPFLVEKKIAKIRIRTYNPSRVRMNEFLNWTYGAG